ncbi:MAG: LacI family DNA-binding transcriptional regulator [Planctomycetota bacterium]
MGPTATPTPNAATRSSAAGQPSARVPTKRDAPATPASKPAGVKRVGIREIAKRANVSVATVSMVINANPKITEATARKVRSVMEETGYRPNRIAQSLSGKYTRTLGVLLPTLRHALADPYFGEIISGILDKADRFGHKVTIESAKPDFIKSRKHLELFERRFVDGVLCIGFNDQHVFLKDFAKHGRAMIAVNNVFPDWPVDHIVCDYAGGAEQVMTYLQQLGHRNIGLIHGSPTVFTAKAIQDVYRRRMRDAGLEVEAGWMIDGRFTEEHGAEAARAMLERHPEVTALFCANDKMAIGAMHACIGAGRLVPRDISVVGFDGIAHGAYVNPSLTTVHLPLHEAGAQACERLINRIRADETGPASATTPPRTLPTHLVLRGSTGLARRDDAA